MSVHVHPYRSLHRRLGRPDPAWHADRLDRAAVLVGSALVVLVATLLLLALVRPGDRGSTSPSGAAGLTATTVTLPDGTPAFLKGRVLYAPSSYAPPGVWTPTSGPGPVR